MTASPTGSRHDARSATPRSSPPRSGGCSTASPGVYDLMNSAMTAGLHHQWRERAVDRAEVGPGDRALDVCCGTGDLALELAAPDRARRPRRRLRLLRADARAGPARRAASRGSPVEFEWADALELPYGDASFDAVTVGFGARNLADLDRGLAEMARVLRPGGRAGDPRDHPARSASRSSSFFSLWFDRLVPLLGARRRRPRRLQLPARVGPELPRAPSSSPRRWTPPGFERDPLAAARRRDHRHPLRALGRPMSRSSVPPPVTAVIDAAAPGCRRGWRRSSERLASSRSATGASSASDAEATLAAGGKRLRPLLVLICAGPAAAASARSGAAVAIELVHMATLVHDDVLDAAPVRRGRPDGGRALGPGARGRRPATCSSRAPSPSSPRRRRRGPRSPSSLGRRSRSPAASSPSAATPSTPSSPRSATSTAAR